VIEWGNKHRQELAAVLLRFARTNILEGRWNSANVFIRYARQARRASRRGGRSMLMTHFLAWDAPNARRKVRSAMRRIDQLVRGECVRNVVWCIDGEECPGGEDQARGIRDRRPEAVLTKRERTLKRREEHGT
jgi:hypothetical protein